MINLLDWALDNLAKAVQSGVGQVQAECPWCGKPKLYLNVDPDSEHYGAWVCFRCDERGSKPLKLMAQVEGIEPEEFVRRSMKGEVKYGRKVERTAREVVSEALPLPELPDGFIPVWDGTRWHYPTYLKERDIERTTAREWGLGYCETGRYAGRLIIPVRCPKGNTFTARDLTGAQEPKYLNPKGMPKGDLLVGWEQLRRITDDTPLLIVEGPFDALKVWQHGYSVVGLLGKTLGPGQALTLVEHFAPGRPLRVLLDPEEQSAPLEVARKLLPHFDDVLLARLEPGVDPGTSTRVGVLEALRRAVSPSRWTELW